MSAFKVENMNNSYDVSKSCKSACTHEKEGLIPVTAVILKKAEVTKEETV